MNDTSRTVLFEETQRFSQRWIWALLILGLIASLLPLILSTTTAVGLTTLAGPLVSLGLILWLRTMRLVVGIDRQGITLRFAGLFVRRQIGLEEIEAFWARRYRPLREYGGWGVRGFAKNRAYNVSGDYGLQLVLRDGKRILIGSQRAQALEEAVAEAAGRAASPR